MIEIIHHNWKDINNINQSTAILQRNCVIKIGEQEYILNVVGVDYEKYSSIFENTFCKKRTIIF